MRITTKRLQAKCGTLATQLFQFKEKITELCVAGMWTFKGKLLPSTKDLFNAHQQFEYKWFAV